jgi:hypothetical protein
MWILRILDLWLGRTDLDVVCREFVKGMKIDDSTCSLAFNDSRIKASTHLTINKDLLPDNLTQGELVRRRNIESTSPAPTRFAQSKHSGIDS